MRKGRTHDQKDSYSSEGLLLKMLHYRILKGSTVMWDKSEEECLCSGSQNTVYGNLQSNSETRHLKDLPIRVSWRKK